jgi:hypothetical protein
MDKINQLIVVYVPTPHLLLSMMVVTIESRKRKCHAHPPIGQMSYIEIGAELTILIIRFGRMMPFVLICLDLLKAHSSIFVILFRNVVYCKTLFICVLNNK